VVKVFHVKSSPPLTPKTEGMLAPLRGLGWRAFDGVGFYQTCFNKLLELSDSFQSTSVCPDTDYKASVRRGVTLQLADQCKVTLLV